MLRVTAMLVASGLAVAACGTSVSLGTVVTKSYSPGHETTIEVPMMIGKVLIEMPEQQWQPPSWSLELRNDQGQTGWVSVSHTTYDQTSQGDQFPTP